MKTRLCCAALLLLVCVSNLHSAAIFDTEKISQEFALNSAQQDTTSKDEDNQNTRIGFWDAVRGKKMTELKPEKTSRLEKFLMGYDEGALGLGWHGLYPKFGGIDSAGGAGLAAGVRFWRRELFGTPLELQAQYLYSIRKYQVGGIQFGRIMKYDVNRLLGLRGYGGLNNFRGLDRKLTISSFMEPIVIEISEKKIFSDLALIHLKKTELIIVKKIAVFMEQPDIV